MAARATKALQALRQMSCLYLPMQTAFYDVMSALQGVVPFESWSLLQVDEAFQPVDFYGSDSVSQQILSRYSERWYNRDEARFYPTQRQMQTDPRLGVLRVSDYTPRFAETELYDEIFAQHRHSWVAGLALKSASGRPIGNLGVGRPPGSGDFTDEEMKLLAMARPLVVQALSPRPNDAAEIGPSGVDETGLVVCDGEGRIEYESPNGWRMLRWAAGAPSDVRIIHDPAYVWARPVLVELARRVTDSLSGRQAELAAVRRTTPYGEFTLRAYVLRPSDKASDLRFAVQIERRTPIALQIFGSPVFQGLTGRQQMVCMHIVRGRSQAEIAEQLGVSANTAVSHIRNLYDRLGVARREDVPAAILGQAA